MPAVQPAVLPEAVLPEPRGVRAPRVGEPRLPRLHSEGHAITIQRGRRGGGVE